MPIREVGRQTKLTAVVELTYADLPTGVSTKVFNLPPNAVVTGGSFVVATVSNAATSESINIGDSASGTQYASGVNGKSAARTAFTAANLDKKYTAKDGIYVTRTEVGAATAGAYRLIVEYVVLGRVSEVQV